VDQDEGLHPLPPPRRVACHLELTVSDSCALYYRHGSIMPPIWNDPALLRNPYVSSYLAVRAVAEGEKRYS
jgi:hypothetical protein